MRRSITSPVSVSRQIWLSFLCRSMPTYSMADPLLVAPMSACALSGALYATTSSGGSAASSHLSSRLRRPHRAIADGGAVTGGRALNPERAGLLPRRRSGRDRPGARLLPASPSEFSAALAVFELDPARYVLDHGRAWLGIPLRGLTRLLARERAS